MKKLAYLKLMIWCFAWVGLTSCQLAEPTLNISSATPVSRSNNPKWRELFLEIKKESEMQEVELLFLGDSLTQGFRFEKKIWNQYYGHRKALNGGIWGDSTQHLLWRLKHDNFGQIAPKIVVLMIGTNNAMNSASAIADGVKANVEEIGRQFPQAKILLLGILPSGRDPISSRRIKMKETNRMISKLADHHKIYYLDLSSQFQLKNGQLKPGLYRSDCLHLKTQGYQVWAKSMEPILKSMYSKSLLTAK